VGAALPGIHIAFDHPDALTGLPGPRGAGMALLADNLAVIDAERMPAYLESTNPANNHRYERLGFRAIGSFAVPRDGHVIATMWRPARD